MSNYLKIFYIKNNSETYQQIVLLNSYLSLEKIHTFHHKHM